MMRKYILSVLAILAVGQVSVAAPITVSSYVYNSGFLPYSGFADNTFHSGNLSGTPAELTDGIVGPADFSNSAWVGMEDPVPDDVGVFQPSLTFDLGGLYNMNSTTITYLVDHPVGQIFAPDSVGISFSEDGSTFTTPTVFTGFNDPNTAISVQSSNFLFGGELAQYVRFDFLNDGRWAFLTEIALDGVEFVPPPIPEPSSFALIGLGLIALRRKRVMRYINSERDRC